MCIKGGKISHIKANSPHEAVEKLNLIAIPGDAVVFYRKPYKHYAIYVSEDWLIDFSDPIDTEKEKGNAQVRLRSSFDSILSSVEIDVYYCCQQLDCICRQMTVARAIEAVEQAEKGEGPYARGKYNLLSNNCEHFCFECVHQARYSSQSHYGTNYGIAPLAAGTGGAAIGVGIGFAGGPFAPITVPLGASIGAMVGGGLALTSSFAVGGALHGVNWGALQEYCSYK